MEKEKVKLTLCLPDLNDREAVETFANNLITHKQVFGVPILCHRIERYLYHREICTNLQSKMEGSINYLAGVRNKEQKKGDKKRSAHASAVQFYNSLNTPSLRLQCQLFNIDFDSYTDIGDVIKQLIAKHTAMMVEGKVADTVTE